MTQLTERISQRETPVNTLRSPETPFSGRLILVTGGSSGTGLAMAEAAHRLGADVIIGTRSQERFEKAKERIGDRTSSLIADLSTPEAGIEAANQLIASNMVPTDVVLSAAGGMESFLKPIAMDFLRFNKAKTPEERSARTKVIQEKIQQGTKEYWEKAQGINFDGQKAFVNTLIPHLKPGAKIIDFSSLWTSVYGQEGVHVPSFYRIIAGTKHMMEEWMEENGKALRERGIYTGIVSGHLITDSETGQMLGKFLLPLLSDDERRVFEDGTIKTQDMVDPTVDLLNVDPIEWGSSPRKVFVFGPGPQFTDTLPLDNPLFTLKFPIDEDVEEKKEDFSSEIIDSGKLLSTWYGTPDAIGIQTLQRVSFLGMPVGVGRSVVSQEQVDYPRRFPMVDTVEKNADGKMVGRVAVTPEKSRGHLNIENGFPLLFPGHKQIRAAVETIQAMEREAGNSHFSRLKSFDLAQFKKGVLADGSQNLTVVPEVVMRTESDATYNIKIVDQDGKETAQIDNLTVSYMHTEDPAVLKEDFIIEAAAQTAGIALLPGEVSSDVMPLFGQVGPVEFSDAMLKPGAEVEYYVGGSGDEKSIDGKMIRVLSNNEDIAKIEGVKALVGSKRLVFRMVGYKPPTTSAN